MFNNAHSGSHDDYGGLHRNLRATGAALDRRMLLRMAARLGMGIGAVQMFGCSSPTAADDTTGLSSTTDEGPTGGSCNSRISAETEGPYPGDGSNGPNVLGASGVVRGDIRSSFAGLSGTADGVPLTIALTIVSVSSCQPLAGRAVYLWHCDRQGRYSLYSQGVTNQNFLRGTQEGDATGRVTFTSIFPGCYAGRWPHIHFEVYPTLASASSVSNKIATSQIALPKASCDAVYATSGYESSVTNLRSVSLSSDMVFSNGWALELATLTGSVGAGFTAALTVGI